MSIYNFIKSSTILSHSLKGQGHQTNIFFKAYTFLSELSYHALIVFLNFLGCLIEEKIKKPILFVSMKTRNNYKYFTESSSRISMAVTFSPIGRFLQWPPLIGCRKNPHVLVDIQNTGHVRLCQSLLNVKYII
jgi:hypothetical protein